MDRKTLAAALPLAPGARVLVPLLVHVAVGIGEGPLDEELRAFIKVEYGHPPPEATEEAPHYYGRRIIIPVTLQLSPCLEVKCAATQKPHCRCYIIRITEEL